MTILMFYMEGCKKLISVADFVQQPLSQFPWQPLVQPLVNADFIFSDDLS